VDGGKKLNEAEVLHQPDTLWENPASRALTIINLLGRFMAMAKIHHSAQSCDCQQSK